MKKQESLLKAFIKKCVLLFVFWLAVFVMLKIFSTLKAESVRKTIKEKMIGSSYEHIDFFDQFLYEREQSRSYLYGIWGYSRFFDYSDREWVEENCGGFPRYEKDDLSLIKYYSELTPGEFMGHSGYYTTVTEAYPLDITLSVDQPLHNSIWWIVFGFMLVIAISSIVVYNKSSADTRSAEEVLIKGLSHDLREPLEALSASVEAWKQADASEKNVLSKSVISDVSRMDSIIKRQLRLRDMSAGKIDLRTEEIDLHYMVKKVIRELRPDFLKREIEVADKSENNDEYIVNADPQLMQLVISNMLLVAADNTEKKVVVQVSPVRKGTRGGNVRFTVSCSDKMFKDLASGALWSVVTDSDSSRTENLGSKGVGLATVVPILKAHGAKYGRTITDMETSFWIELKMADFEG